MSLPSDTTRTSALPWTAGRRVAFRFAAAYWLLFTLPFPLGLLAPWSDWLDMKVMVLQRELGAWVGRHVLGLSGELGVDFNGSGDRTTDYLYVLAILVIAGAVAAIWTGVDRRRPDYRRAAQVLSVLVRYYLATVMFAYGFAKVFRGQFVDPSLGTLVQTYGDSSPMHLLWTFMGHSAPYTVFTGAVEVLAGLLFLSRRTTSLAALLTVAVMSNIFMLNMSYDVPVKLFSFHLLVFAAAMIIPDAKRLCNALVLGRATAAPNLGWRPASVRGRRAALAAKLAVVGAILFATTYDNYTRYRDAGKDMPALYGLYDVDTFRRNGTDVPPLLTEDARWRQAYVTRWSSFATTSMTGETVYYRLQHDPDARTIELTKFDDGGKTTHTLSAVPGDGGTLRLQGKLGDDELDVVLRERDTSSFLLQNRGFHWINEYPYNR